MYSKQNYFLIFHDLDIQCDKAVLGVEIISLVEDEQDNIQEDDDTNNNNSSTYIGLPILRLSLDKSVGS